MEASVLRRTLLGAAVVAAIGAAEMPTADAAVYRTRFDPPGVITFSGEAFFTVDDACLQTDGWKAVNDFEFHLDVDPYSFIPSCGSLVMTSAFADVDDGMIPATGRVDFAPPPNSDDLWGIFVSGGELAGVDSFVIGPATSPDFPGYFWWLQFESGQAPVGHVHFPGGDPVFLFRSDCIDVGESCEFVEAAPALNVTFERIPEPETLALIMGGLVAAWAARRRRSMR